MDNAIIVQELIHTMDKKKGKTGVMAIKLDLEKAYDRLEWGFIRDTLKLFRFPSHLTSLIISCVSTTSISIKNGPAISHLFFADDLMLIGKIVWPLKKSWILLVNFLGKKSVV